MNGGGGGVGERAQAAWIFSLCLPWGRGGRRADAFRDVMLGPTGVWSRVFSAVIICFERPLKFRHKYTLLLAHSTLPMFQPS